MTRCHPGALLERDIWSESLEESKDQNYYSEAKKNVVKKVRKEYDAPMILSIMSKLVGGGGSVIVVWNDIFVFKNILFEVNRENYKKNFLDNIKEWCYKTYIATYNISCNKQTSEHSHSKIIWNCLVFIN